MGNYEQHILEHPNKIKEIEADLVSAKAKLKLKAQDGEPKFLGKVFPESWTTKNGGGGVLPYPKALGYNKWFLDRELSPKAMDVLLILMLNTNHKRSYPECWHTRVKVETLSEYMPGSISPYLTMLRTKEIICPICEEKIADSMIKARSNGRGWDCDLTPALEVARHLQMERVDNPDYDLKKALWIKEQTPDQEKQTQSLIEYHLKEGHNVRGLNDQEPSFCSDSDF